MLTENLIHHHFSVCIFYISCTACCESLFPLKWCELIIIWVWNEARTDRQSEQPSLILVFIFTRDAFHGFLLIPALHMWRSLCAEREIRGKDDKSILQITRLCVYYSELEHDIQSSSMLAAFGFFFPSEKKEKEKRKYHSPTGSTERTRKGRNYSWGWRGRVSLRQELSSAHLHLSLTWERGRLWSCLAEHVNSHSCNDSICRCQRVWRLKSTRSGWFKQNMIVIAL